MRNYSASEIDQNVASGSPFDKAGGYGVQDQTLNPVAHVDGCRANVIGLPLCTMTHLFKELRFNVESLSLPAECRRHLRAIETFRSTPDFSPNSTQQTNSIRRPKTTPLQPLMKQGKEK